MGACANGRGPSHELGEPLQYWTFTLEFTVASRGQMVTGNMAYLTGVAQVNSTVPSAASAKISWQV